MGEGLGTCTCSVIVGFLGSGLEVLLPVEPFLNVLQGAWYSGTTF